MAAHADWPAICSWRDAHFARMASRQRVARVVLPQRSFDSATWVVSELGGNPVAAYSYFDAPDYHFRYVHDFYRAPSRRGFRGMLELLTFMHYSADDVDLEIRASADVENADWLRHVWLKGYEPFEVRFRRPRRSER